MGSVKDLIIKEKPDNGKPGRGRFIFSNRYSVFDWGEMPDHIKNKGASLCMVGAYFFEKLKERGIKTHYEGIIEMDEPKLLAELSKPVNTMEVKLFRVLEPELKDGGYDYSVYNKEKSNFLIPLEIIYRNSLPAGSSIFKRLKDGNLKLSDIGLDSMPEPGNMLKDPIYDVSTKLEPTDRYVSWEEAEKMAVLTKQELSRIKDAVATVNNIISDEVAKLGLVNSDGKIELGFDENRELVVVDVLGTLDECRFTFNGMQVSKEIARIHYRKTSWFDELDEAKKKDRVNWKQHVSSGPPNMPERLAELISIIYQAFCNEVTGRNWFEVPALKDALSEIDDLLKQDI